MSIETPKSNEIKRLTTPLTIKDFKAYDSQGKLLKCSETISDVRFIVEPRPHILNDNEILQYAPQSKSASQIRLKRGFGNIQDILLVHESLPWILGLYYVALICAAIPIVFSKFIFGMYLVLVLIILPLLYLYYIFNFKSIQNTLSRNLLRNRSRKPKRQKLQFRRLPLRNPRVLSPSRNTKRKSII